MLIRMVSFFIVGIVIGTTFPNIGYSAESVQNRFSVFFGLNSFLCLLSIGTMPSLMAERDVVRFERSNGAYRVEAFVIAQLLASIPWIFILSVLPSMTSYWIIGFQIDAGKFFEFLCTLFFMILAAESLTLVMVLIAPVFVVGVALALSVYGYFMQVEGFLIPPNKLPTFWRYLGYYISFLSYVYSSWSKNEFIGLTINSFIYCEGVSFRPGQDPLNPVCFPPTTGCNGQSSGEQVLMYYGFTEWSKWWDVGIIALFALGFRTIYYLLLKLVYRPKKHARG